MARKKIFEGVMKDMSHYAGKAALKLSYPVAGMMPARCQKWLERKFKSFNAIDASLTSVVGEYIGGTAGIIWHYYKSLEHIPISGYPYLSVAEFAGCLLSVYVFLEAQFRGGMIHDSKEPYGSLLLKALTASEAYLYDKWQSGKKRNGD